MICIFPSFHHADKNLKINFVLEMILGEMTHKRQLLFQRYILLNILSTFALTRFASERAEQDRSRTWPGKSSICENDLARFLLLNTELFSKLQ